MILPIAWGYLVALWHLHKIVCNYLEITFKFIYCFSWEICYIYDIYFIIIDKRLQFLVKCHFFKQSFVFFPLCHWKVWNNSYNRTGRYFVCKHIFVWYTFIANYSERHFRIYVSLIFYAQEWKDNVIFCPFLWNISFLFSDLFIFNIIWLWVYIFQIVLADSLIAPYINTFIISTKTSL